MEWVGPGGRESSCTPGGFGGDDLSLIDVSACTVTASEGTSDPSTYLTMYQRAHRDDVVRIFTEQCNMVRNCTQGTFTLDHPPTSIFRSVCSLSIDIPSPLQPAPCTLPTL
jgi:hypothetical protein